MQLRQTKWVIGLVLVGIGIATIVTTTLPQATKYYLTVEELFQDPKKYQNLDLKVAGKVVAGSISKTELRWDFEIYHQAQTLAVSFQGAMPDTFKEEADVVVEGTYLGGKDFRAKIVLAKCASRYEEKLQPSLDTPAPAPKA